MVGYVKLDEASQSFMNGTWLVAFKDIELTSIFSLRKWAKDLIHILEN